MHRSARRLLAAALAALTTAGAPAAYLIDTGPGPTPEHPTEGSYLLAHDQSLGTTFELASASTITAVEIYLSVSRREPVATELTISLHAGSPNSAGLFLETFSLAITDEGWVVSRPIAWSVGPGTYTVTFETSYTGEPYIGAEYPARTQLTSWYRVPDSPWFLDEESPGGFLVRVSGTVAAVPEPETFGLMLGGLGLVVAWSSRHGAERRSRTAS